MGASASKAAQSGARKFPTRAPGSAPAAATTPRPRPPPIRADDPTTTTVPPAESMTPVFAARLQQMGIARPSPTWSPSSTAAGPRASPDVSARNATLGVLEARRRIQDQADAEREAMGRSGFAGRELLPVATIRDALVLRRRGRSDGEIETRLGLRPGVVGRLGPLGLVSVVEEGAGSATTTL